MNEASALRVCVKLCKHRGPVNAVLWNSLCLSHPLSSLIVCMMMKSSSLFMCCLFVGWLSSYCLFAGAGQYCITGGSDGDIHLWNPYTGKLIKSYQDHARSVLSLSLFVSCFSTFIWLSSLIMFFLFLQNTRQQSHGKWRRG